MIKIGLTGGIGSGKSTISDFFREIGISVVDADKISREVLMIYPNILIEIKKEFGDRVITESGELDRRALGAVIFGDEKKKKRLEEIIIPYILKEIDMRVEKLDICGEEIVVIDAPTLMENNMDRDMDYNMVVWVDQDTQLDRIRKRDGLTRDEIISRIQSQMSLDEKKERADYIIDNRKSVQDTLEQVRGIFEEIIRMEKK